MTFNKARVLRNTPKVISITPRVIFISPKVMALSQKSQSPAFAKVMLKLCLNAKHKNYFRKKQEKPIFSLDVTISIQVLFAPIYNQNRETNKKKEARVDFLCFLLR